jgi:hypothetical protein
LKLTCNNNDDNNNDDIQPLSKPKKSKLKDKIRLNLKIKRQDNNNNNNNNNHANTRLKFVRKHLNFQNKKPIVKELILNRDIIKKLVAKSTNSKIFTLI